MLTEKELLEAIEECQSALPKNFSTCEKLAVFYTILDHLNAENSYKTMLSADSNPRENLETVVGDYGTSEFFAAVRGKEAEKVWPIFGELMDALKVLNPKLYTRTIERLTALEKTYEIYTNSDFDI